MIKKVHEIVIKEGFEWYEIYYKTYTDIKIFKAFSQSTVRKIVTNLVRASGNRCEIINHVDEFEGALWLEQ